MNGRAFPVSQPGGSVQTAIRLTTELIEKTSHEVVLFGPDSLSNTFEVPIRSNWADENQLWGTVWERTVLPQLVARSEIDVLYCPNSNAPLHDLNVPVVMCIHDISPQKGWSAKTHQLYRKLIIPQTVRASDAVVTVSEFSKEEIVQIMPVLASKVSVIYNGVDNHYFEGKSKAIDLPERYLLFVGSLNPRKNISGLIKGYQKIKSDRDIQMVFIGPGNKFIFKDMNISSLEGVTHHGYLDAAEVKYAYENAEMLVYPSFYEGFGLPPLESFACGTPVVASNRGSLPEVLGDAAVYVNADTADSIADGIKEVLEQDSANVGRLRSQAKKFTWESAASRLTKNLESVI